MSAYVIIDYVCLFLVLRLDICLFSLKKDWKHLNKITGHKKMETDAKILAKKPGAFELRPLCVTLFLGKLKTER